MKVLREHTSERLGMWHNAGASVDNYYMEGRDAASVKPGQGDLVVVDMKGEATKDDRLLCTFRLYLPYAGADLDKPIPILCAPCL